MSRMLATLRRLEEAKKERAASQLAQANQQVQLATSYVEALAQARQNGMALPVEALDPHQRGAWLEQNARQTALGKVYVAQADKARQEAAATLRKAVARSEAFAQVMRHKAEAAKAEKAKRDQQKVMEAFIK